MRISLPDDDARKLGELKKTAERTKGSRVSRSAWLRGAVRVAGDDEEIARKIADAAPETGHGGARPGAGRPRGAHEQEERRDGTSGQEQDD